MAMWWCSPGEAQPGATLLNLQHRRTSEVQRLPLLPPVSHRICLSISYDGGSSQWHMSLLISTANTW